MELSPKGGGFTLEEDTKMRKCMTIAAVAALVLACVPSTRADMFGTGGNQFDIDFVPISGDTNPSSGYGIVNNDYRMGVYEITNDQWDKFKGELGVPVTGDPSYAYDEDPYWTGTNVPTNEVSWYEAAQFVNWLNTSTGNLPAYKFTGTQGMGDYALDTWSAAEACNGTNLYRHKDAFYYLPTEDEWVKAGYWNGTALQTWATPDDSVPVAGVDSNFDSVVGQPWDVGSGSKELNGTFDMMGNVWEWMESPWTSGDYGTGSYRGLRGGSYFSGSFLASSARYNNNPYYESNDIGFRVASGVPEPSSLALLWLGGLALMKRRRG